MTHLSTKYPKYLYYGGEYYDVELKVYSAYSSNTKDSITILNGCPGIALSRANGIASGPTSYIAQLWVYKAGTTSPSNIDFYFSFSDVDTNEIYRTYLSNTKDYARLPKGITSSTTNIKYTSETDGTNFSGADSSGVDASSFFLSSAIMRQKDWGGLYFPFRYGTMGNSTYAMKIGFEVEDIKVPVNYQWRGDYPSGVTLPASTEVSKGTMYTVSNSYVGSRMVGTKDGRKGLWEFQGWDKSGSIPITQSTTIYGQWKFTPYYNVTYQWEGQYPPSKSPPKGQADMTTGQIHTIDTTYKQGQEVREPKGSQDGIWTFNGWIPNTNITIQNKDEVVKGTWDFRPLWHIDSEVVNGKITPSDHNIESGENRTFTYSPNEGYQLKEVIVDGVSINIRNNPDSYTFTNINENHKIKVIYELIPNLEITKTSNRKHYNVGDEILYTVKIDQTIPGAEARIVRATDLIPRELKLIPNSLTSSEPSFKVINSNDNLYTVHFNKVTDSVTYTYKCKLKEEVDTHKLINTVMVAAENEPTPKQDDNEVNFHIPELELNKKVDKTECFRDNTLNYTVTAKQTHEGSELRDAVLSDDIPDGTELINDSVKINGNEATHEVKDGKLLVNIPVLSTELKLEYSLKVKTEKYKGNIPNTAKLDGYISGEQKIPQPLTSSVNTTVIPPDATIEKEVSDNNPVYNDIIEYTITVNQIVEGTYLKDVKLTDDIPEGIELVDGSINCTVDGNELSNDKINVNGKKLEVSIGKLTSNAVLKFKGKVKAKSGEVRNEVVLSTPELEEDKKGDVLLIVKEPELDVSKTVDDDKPFLDDIIKFTVIANFTNLVNGILTDDVPEYLELVPETVQTEGVEGIQCLIEGNKIKVLLPENKTTGQLILMYNAIAKKVGKVINTAIFDGENNVTGEKRADQPVEIVNPKLEIEKSADEHEFVVGEIVNYTIKTSIEGARKTVLTDKVPEGLKLIKDSVKVQGIENTKVQYNDEDENKFTILYPEEKTKGELTVTYSAEVKELGEWTNEAELICKNTEEEPKKASDTINVIPPTLELTKKVSDKEPLVNDIIEYEVSAEIKDARKAQIVDNIPEGIELDKDSVEVIGVEEYDKNIESNKITITLPEKRTSANVSIKYKALVKEIGEWINKASLDCLNNDKEPREAEEKIDVKPVRLEINKRVSDEKPFVNDVIEYTIEAKCEQTRGAKITDEIPEGVNIDKSSIEIKGIEKPDYTFEENKLMVNIPDKKEAQEIKITYLAKVEKVGTHINTATIDSKNNQEEPKKSDAQIEVLPPEFTINKKVNNENPYVKDIVEYTINSGFKNARNVVVTDKLPKGITLNKDSIKANGIEDVKIETENEEIKITIPTGITEGNIELKYTAEVKETGNHINIASITSRNNENDPVKSEAKINVVSPKFQITKKVDKKKVNINKKANYTITAKFENARSVIITDKLPNGVNLKRDSIKIKGVERVKKSIDKKQIKITIPKEITKGKVIITYYAKATKKGTHKNIASITSLNNTDTPIFADANIKVTKPKAIKSDKVIIKKAKTGDNSNVGIYIVLAIISLGLIMSVMVFKRK